MHRKIQIFLIFLIFYVIRICTMVDEEPNSNAVMILPNEVAMIQQVDIIQKKCEHSCIPAVVEIEELWKDSTGVSLSEEDINLIALVTMAEAEGESEYGKRLVIDTILNRLDSIYYPDTIPKVIYQPYQFSSMWNGRVDKCYVMDEICQLVKEELQERKNYKVIFFTAGKYGKYGNPMFQEGNHYFSSYE